MHSVDEILDILRKETSLLQTEYRVKRIGIFGSYARKTATSKSDIDILVDFAEPVGIITFMRLEEFLEEKFGYKVDLVTSNAIKSQLRKSIFEDMIYV